MKRGLVRFVRRLRRPTLGRLVMASVLAHASVLGLALWLGSGGALTPARRVAEPLIVELPPAAPGPPLVRPEAPAPWAGSPAARTTPSSPAAARLRGQPRGRRPARGSGTAEVRGAGPPGSGTARLRPAVAAPPPPPDPPPPPPASPAVAAAPRHRRWRPQRPPRHPRLPQWTPRPRRRRWPRQRPRLRPPRHRPRRPSRSSSPAAVPGAGRGSPARSRPARPVAEPRPPGPVAATPAPPTHGQPRPHPDPARPLGRGVARPRPPAESGGPGPALSGRRFSLLPPRLDPPAPSARGEPSSGTGGTQREGSGSGEAGAEREGQPAIPLNTPDPRYAEYFLEIKRRIEAHLVYPDEAARRNQSGQLLLEFVVRKDGSLRAVELTRSSGVGVLDSCSLRR